MPRREKTLDFGHMSVRVNELTVDQVINLMRGSGIDFDPMLWLSGQQEFPHDLASLFADLPPASIGKLSFSELKEIIEAVKEVNQDLFFVVMQLAELAGTLKGMSENESSKQSVSSSVTGTTGS